MLLEKQALSKPVCQFLLRVVAYLFRSQGFFCIWPVILRTRRVRSLRFTLGFVHFAKGQCMTDLIAFPFSTCDFCDAHKSGETAHFRVLPPVFKDFGGQLKFAGQVVTVKCYEDNSLVKKMVESEGAGRVLVVDGAGSLRRALMGGNLAAAAARNGWAGVVVDGCVRDAAELLATPIGIRALALHPMPTLRSDQGQRQVDVFIQGVCVRPGDWLYADADGMVVCAEALTALV